MADNITLRGLVVSKFGSVASFAREIGWKYGKANRIVCGGQDPDAAEIKEMVRVLEISDPATVTSVFLK